MKTYDICLNNNDTCVLCWNIRDSMLKAGPNANFKLKLYNQN